MVLTKKPKYANSTIARVNAYEYVLHRDVDVHSADQRATLNPLRAEFLGKEHKHISTFYVIPPH